ncbi:Histidine kinase [Azospirillaceae bacterium]
MLFQNTRLATRLMVGFVVMIVLVWGLGVVMLKRITTLSSESQRIYEHPLTVSNSVLEANAAVFAMEAYLTDMLLPRNRLSVQKIISDINSLKVLIDQKMRVVERQFLGNPSEVFEALSAISDWMSLMNEAVALIKQQDYERAQTLHDDEMGMVEVRIKKEMNDIVAFARNKAKSISDASVLIMAAAQDEIFMFLIFFSVLSLVISVVVTRSLSVPLKKLQKCMVELAGGNLSIDVPYWTRRSEIGKMAGAVQVFRESAEHLFNQRWLRAQIAQLAMIAQTSDSPAHLGERVLFFLLSELGGRFGVFYIYDEALDRFYLAARLGTNDESVSFDESVSLDGDEGDNGKKSDKKAPEGRSFALGEGLVGQCAVLRRVLVVDDAPEDYFFVESGLGKAKPRSLVFLPALTRDRVLAVVEIGFFSPLSSIHRTFIEEAGVVLALNLDVLERYEQTRSFLKKTQSQAEELLISKEQLTINAESLREANRLLQEKSDILEIQAEELRVSEEEMRVQQEELNAANQELSAKGLILEKQAEDMKAAYQEAERRSIEAALASRYKSEFLANMSHELRTPLNSMLILAKSLAENEGGNLTSDQIESAGIIYDGGAQLLHLINDVLDLAKVEAGKMEAQARLVSVSELLDMIERRFRRMAQVKNVAFSVMRHSDAPSFLWLDSGKLEQILTNLLGNAVKFTEVGCVSLSFEPWSDGRRHRERAGGCVGDELAMACSTPDRGWLAFRVQDTGVGITQEKLSRVFEAFEQGDGAVNRRYGGTGLGLAISQKLARLMGGVIQAASVLGGGSVFTLLLPYVLPPKSELDFDVDSLGGSAPDAVAAKHQASNEISQFVAGECSQNLVLKSRSDTVQNGSALKIEDDREHIVYGEQVILIIEDDPFFARIVMDLARKKGFRCLVATDGETGVVLARKYLPTGVILDIGLPGMNGWGVMEQLKATSELRAIPIHVVSAQDRETQARAMGALSCLTKPVSKMQIEGVLQEVTSGRARRLLVADTALEARKQIIDLVRGIENGGALVIEEADSARQVWKILQERRHDCLLIDVDLPDGGCLVLLERLRKEKHLENLPLIVLSSRDLSREETNALRGFTDSIIISSPQFQERLVNEVTLFLHSVRATFPGEVRQKPLAPQAKKYPSLSGRMILVVDDDMRNAFALSKVLRGQGMHVLIAQDGRKALTQLNENARVEIVLMDIMMPEMDGYEAMQEIRKQERFAALPIIALTAKAMMGDAKKCIDAGANDYLSKPVDIEKLMDILVHRIGKAESVQVD